MNKSEFEEFITNSLRIFGKAKPYKLAVTQQIEELENMRSTSHLNMLLKDLKERK